MADVLDAREIAAAVRGMREPKPYPGRAQPGRHRPWLRARHVDEGHSSRRDTAAAYVVPASTYRRALDIVPLAALVERAVDVPVDPGTLGA